MGCEVGGVVVFILKVWRVGVGRVVISVVLLGDYGCVYVLRLLRSKKVLCVYVELVRIKVFIV